ncbi:hypothetical protein VTN00DRAFT_5524 [Thermoascus crustaceus]|uniref:uncharacterized protein n=1 Tax=Thermoascus crustaceus TaxID=5088 RepID=UPI003742AE89
MSNTRFFSRRLDFFPVMKKKNNWPLGPFFEGYSFFVNKFHSVFIMQLFPFRTECSNLSTRQTKEKLPTN